METDLPAPRIPSSTYRLQFNASFGFEDAARIIPYLHDLGITDIYASPYFRARKGSLHGYDIIDHSSLNPEIGTEQQYDLMVGELLKRGMGQMLDIVPNHMCITDSENRWWMDVLENGPSSLYADFFDIDWDPVKKELKDKVLFPILGDQYGKVLETGELRLAFEGGAFFVYYHEHKFPIIPKTYADILGYRMDCLRGNIPAEDEHLVEFLSIITALDHLPSYLEKDPEKVAERYREKEVVKKRLSTLCSASPVINEFIGANVGAFNGIIGSPASFDLLDYLLGKQPYRLSYWSVATDEINYRRFFDINELAAIKVERPEVFRETHSLIMKLVAAGKVTGLRVDHADGLYDPSAYFRRLQKECFIRLKAGREDPASATFPETETSAAFEEVTAADPRYMPFYIVGEKILVKGERMPEEWPIFSTTGYTFLNSLTGLFILSKNTKAFDRIYRRFSGIFFNYQDIVYEEKKLILQVAMSSEVSTLGHYLNSISEKNRHTRDFTLNSLKNALVEVIAFFPVYRTYVNSLEGATDRDRQIVESAVSKAKKRNPATSESLYDFLRDVLLLRFPEQLSGPDRQEWLEFTMRFQQITGPVTAKGVEDTAFYIYNRLASLNEVGGMPDRFGIPVDTFHGQTIERAKSWPHALITTSTHDTKRSEDMRARLNVLSEVPDEWRQCIVRWGRMNRKKQQIVDARRVPERNEEYLLYQTLLGSWPAGQAATEDHSIYTKRISDYMLKAVREAKVNSSWISPNERYESALLAFVDAIMDRNGRNEFLRDFLRFQEKIAFFGMLNSLSQTLFKITSPGVPDFYQGTELWDFRLVDPDNRGPVDYERRIAMMEDLTKREAEMGKLGLAKELARDMNDGGVKLYLTMKALNLRRKKQELFESGEYLPLQAEGDRKENICALARRSGRQTAITAVPRFMVELIPFPGGPSGWGDIWQGSDLILPFSEPEARYRNAFTDEILVAEDRQGVRVLPLSRIFDNFPVALLTGGEDEL